MNKKYILLILIITVIFNACDDKEFDPVLNISNLGSITFTLSNIADAVLVEAEEANDFATFSWTEPEFGFSAAIEYTLEIDEAGNDFANAVTLGVVRDLSFTFTNGDFNGILLAKGLPDNTASTLDFRVKAVLDGDIDPIYSNTVTANVTPYAAFVVYPQLQVPGSHQGWDPANNNTVIYSLGSDQLYEGYIYFNTNAVEFKYTDGPDWAVNWGDDGADGILELGGANILAGDAGLYKLNVDLNTLNHTFEKTSWGVIGSALADDWNSDEDMTFDEVTNKYTLTTNLTAEELKFRANDDWVLDLGDDDANGSLEYGGANIVVPEAGNYTIELILSGPGYTYTLTKN